jgi:glutaconate CoA-transferase, subunit B
MRLSWTGRRWCGKQKKGENKVSNYAKDYTIDELFISTLAREIKDEDRVMLAVEVPLCLMAWLLAQKTHAPNSGSWTLAGGLDPRPSSLPLSTADPRLLEGALSSHDLSTKVGMARMGRYDIMFLSGVQIDQYGNVNNSAIGDFKRPKVRLPGGAGGAEMIHISPKTILYRTKHDKKTFVERVDFITYPGWIDSAGWRRGGPEKLITNLAVMAFDAKTKKIRLESVHPGVEVEEVVANTGFEFTIPKKVPKTEPPTQEQVELIRSKVDPQGLRKSQFL